MDKQIIKIRLVETKKNSCFECFFNPNSCGSLSKPKCLPVHHFELIGPYEFESVDSEDEKIGKINLCDTCIHEFATCISGPVFVCDDGGTSSDDNVTSCPEYKYERKR